MTHNTHQGARTVLHEEQVHFGVKDRLNRDIGCFASYGTIEYIENTPGQGEGSHRYGYDIAPGTWYFLSTHATRNNSHYQSGNSSLHSTEAEVKIAFQKYIDAARKRGLKREGK